VIAIVATAPGPRAQNVAPLSLEQIFAKRPIYGVAPTDVRISPDGSWVLSSEVPVDQAGTARLVLRDAANGKVIPLAVQPNRPELAEFGSVGTTLFVARKRELFVLQSRDEAPFRLLDDGVVKHDFETMRRFDDGSLYLRAGEQHWVIERGSRSPQSLTLPIGARVVARSLRSRRLIARLQPTTVESDPEAVGKPKTETQTLIWIDLKTRKQRPFVLPASLDKVALSPDGSAAAISTTVEPARGPAQLIPDYLSREVRTIPARRSRVGDDPVQSVVRLVKFRAGRIEMDPLPLEPGTRAGAGRDSILSLSFGPRGKSLLVQTLSADYRVRRLLVFETKTRSMRVLVEDRDEAWIGKLACYAGFTPTGDHVLYTSERDGTARLFRVATTGGASQAASPKGVEVERVIRQPGGQTLLVLAEPDPSRRSVHVWIPERNECRKLRQPLGWNTEPLVSENGRRVVFFHASLFRPAELYATGLGRDAEVTKLSTTTPPSFLSRPWLIPETIEYQNSDDKQRIRAHLFRPLGKRPKNGWPAVIFLHGAGYLQNVRDAMTAYPSNLLFHERLARRGYVVLSPDFRGSRGYGRKFRTDVYKDLGGPDRRDVVAARAFLVRRANVDPERIGLYGGSYGGFLTLMCLFKEPDAFAAGAALRPVTDWTRYHPGYTYPRLGRPDAPGGAEVYRNTSPIHFAEHLTKPLLLLHGMRDSNVFVQDTVRLVERLVQLGKDFDVMLYPSQNHAFDDAKAWVDEYRRIERLFDRKLRG